MVIDATTIVLADDDARIRAQVRRTLEAAGFAVVAEASDAAGAVAAAVALRPQVCLLDISMPGGGIRAAAEITLTVPSTAVVMFTVSTTTTDLFEALRAGARGYLLKDTDPHRLPLAIKGVLQGEAPLPRHLVARIVEEFRIRDRPRRGEEGAPLSRLTNREWDVLELLRQGLTTAEVAERLFVTDATVRSHTASVLHKLKVHDRAEALAVLEAHLSGPHPPT